MPVCLRIRAQLLDALPDYMVPSHIMVLERFRSRPTGRSTVPPFLVRKPGRVRRHT
jgi:hypothetical protein